ncbi:MAG: FKBP-type peptidyl-prolyl cis-trans isomerase [Terrimonas sp.]|nr:FKBP-type peptidyl-prolyl cis-trans isomerase [Terrimonas sp.]
MKTKNSLFVIVAMAAIFFTACNQLSFKKAASGLVYKIIPGSQKNDSLIKSGNAVKFQFIRKYNDSVMYESYGKMPGFARVDVSPGAAYSLLEILPMMRKGDSAVIIEMADTLLNKGVRLWPGVKKGDRFVTSFRIVDVFTNDSLAQADYSKEMEKDKPRQMKEQEEQMAKLQQQKMEQQQKDFEEMEKSGEVAKGIKEVEDYLKSKNIKAVKTGKGTFVVVKEEGTGPAVVNGKYLLVKYSGRIMSTDSTFESGSYPFQIGKGGAIQGFDEGLLLFKQGGKGTLYIPGFLAYGKNPGPGNSPYEALTFDVEVVGVADQPITPGEGQ